MAYLFQAIDILIFDVHTAVVPVLKPSCLQVSFQLLCDPSAYKKAHEAQKLLATKNFSIRPLSARSLKRNHFWKYYAKIWMGAPNEFGRLQLPFVCHPTQVQVSLTLHQKDAAAVVRPLVYLTGVGWSSNLEISLKGSFKPDQLVNLMSRLRSTTKPILKVDGKVQNLSSLFALLTSRLQEDLFEPHDMPSTPATTPRHWVISLAQYTGPEAYYRSRGPASLAMADVERAKFVSLLFGRPVDIAEMAQREKENKILLTQFGGSNFALTDFDQGTLLFMQRDARPGARRRKSLRCLASNVRCCSMMTLVFLNFFRNSKSYGGTSPQMKALRADLKLILTELRKNYTNLYCSNLFAKHGGLQEFI